MEVRLRRETKPIYYISNDNWTDDKDQANHMLFEEAKIVKENLEAKNPKEKYSLELPWLT